MDTLTDPSLLSHVYVVEDAAGRCKIGIAADPVSRLKGMQTGHADLLTLRLALSMPAAYARPVERECHALLLPGRRRGEWFAVSSEKAVETVKAVANRLVPDIDAATLSAALECIEHFRNVQQTLYWANRTLKEEEDAWTKRRAYLLSQIKEAKFGVEAAKENFHQTGAPLDLWERKAHPLLGLLRVLYGKPPP